MTVTRIDRAEALAERLSDATIGTLELFSVYLGTELGLYRAAVSTGVAEATHRSGWSSRQSPASST